MDATEALTDAVIVQATEAGLRVDGEVTYQNADELAAKGIDLIKSLKDAPGVGCAIDLGGVREPRTIVVAVVLSWFRALRSRGTQLQLIDVSPSLQRILQFTGVMNVLDSSANGGGLSGGA